MDPLNRDNIIAEITPSGRGGVSVIRISGPDTVKIVNKSFGLNLCQERHVYFLDHDIDEVLCVYYKAPRSYTGEDVCELFCHGNPTIVYELIKHSVDTAGGEYRLRHAQRGEFTKRAYLNGKMDLLQAEAVLDVINASNVNIAKQKKKLLGGLFSKELHVIEEGLMELVSSCDAVLDFSDDDSLNADYDDIFTKANNINDKLDMLIASCSTIVDVSLVPSIVIVGRPNVGKSSLFNKLLEYERAIVHHNPGTTRDYIEEAVIIDGVELTIVDTAGLRNDPACDIEKYGIDKVTKLLDVATIVLEVSDDDIFEQKGNNVVKVRNKIDTMKGLPTNNNVFHVSAISGAGIVALKRHIFGLVKHKVLLDSHKENKYLINNNIINMLKEMHLAIQITIKAIAGKTPLDVVATLLRQNMGHIRRMTGEEGLDDKILDTIFSRFCIGK